MLREINFYVNLLKYQCKLARFCFTLVTHVCHHYTGQKMIVNEFQKDLRVSIERKFFLLDSFFIEFNRVYSDKLFRKTFIFLTQHYKQHGFRRPTVPTLIPRALDLPTRKTVGKLFKLSGFSYLLFGPKLLKMTSTVFLKRLFRKRWFKKKNTSK